MSNRKQKSILNLDWKFLSDFISLLLAKKKVKVTGLGIFKIVPHKGRKMTNPFTGKPMVIKDYKKIRFLPTASLKEKIQ